MPKKKQLRYKDRFQFVIWFKVYVYLFLAFNIPAV